MKDLSKLQNITFVKICWCFLGTYNRQTWQSSVRFPFPMAVSMKVTVFWYVASCNLVYIEE
jgi:hypothetical protein